MDPFDNQRVLILNYASQEYERGREDCSKSLNCKEDDMHGNYLVTLQDAIDAATEDSSPMVITNFLVKF